MRSCLCSVCGILISGVLVGSLFCVGHIEVVDEALWNRTEVEPAVVGEAFETWAGVFLGLFVLFTAERSDAVLGGATEFLGADEVVPAHLFAVEFAHPFVEQVVDVGVGGSEGRHCVEVLRGLLCESPASS